MFANRLAGFLALGLAACSPAEPAPQASLDSPDAASCKAVMALPQSQGCDLHLNFGPVSPQAGATRRAAVQAWLAANPWAVVRDADEASMCLTVPFERDTPTAYDALKAIGATSAAGAMQICTDTGQSFRASDPVDHGGDEGKR